MSPFTHRFARVPGSLIPALMLAAVTATSAGAQTLTLGEAVGSALATNPSLTAADARSLAADEGSVALRAQRLPTVAASVGVTRFQEPMLVAPLHGLDLMGSPPTFDLALVQSRVGLEYTLVDGGARSARIREGEARAAGASQARSALEMQLIEEVATAYLQVLSSRSVLDAADARVESLEAEAERVGRNVAVGTAAEVERLRAAASLESARAERASAEARLGWAERSLARLSGLPTDRIVSGTLAQVAPTAPPAATSEAPLNPTLAGAQEAVRAAGEAVSEQRARRFPSIGLTAAALQFGTVSGDHVVEWQAGLQVTWPVFTGGARGAGIRRAQAELRAAESDLASAELRIDQELDAARTALQEAEARMEALASAVTQWEEVARIEALALSAGSGVQSDLLLAEAGLYSARAGLARATNDAALAQIRVARAQGVLTQDWIERTLETAR